MAVLLFAFKLPFLLITSTLSLTFLARPHFSPRSIRSRLSAEIRPPTPKADNLAFGWDGTTAKGGAVDDSKPSRMLEEILATGETIPSEIEVFLANCEMSPDSIIFQEVIDAIEVSYEDHDIEFVNGGVVNTPGENHGTAKLLSLAALCQLSKETTLSLWGEYYRGVRDTPDGDDHSNIRAFMKEGWDGVKFDNGVALTKKVTGDGGWGWDEESFIP